MSELIKRILVALISIPIAFVIIVFGNLPFLITIVAISSLTLWEYYRIAEKKHAFPNKLLGIIAGIAIMYIFWNYPFFQASFLLIPGFIIFVIMVLIIELWKKKPNAGLNTATTVFGFFYIPLSFSFLIALREFYSFISTIQDIPFGSEIINFNGSIIFNDSSENAYFLISIFVAVWVCDSAAYFVGKNLGRHKLFKRISPNKTWEGAIGGFIFAIIAFAASTEILLTGFPIIHSVVIGSIVGIFGQIGDLAESQLKRDAGVKDSSTLIPGHGGMLDRFDSILFIMPLIYVYLLLISFIV